MTREPDRFEAKARDVSFQCHHTLGAGACRDCIAAALRREASDALERAAQAFNDEFMRTGKLRTGFDVADDLRAMSRALASPAAAPAAETCRIGGTPHEVTPLCVPEPVAPAAETCSRCGGDVDHGRGCSDTAPPSEPVAPAGYAQPPDPEGDRNRHNAMLVEAWREEFSTLCEVLFPGNDGPIGWKHVQAKVKALADGGEGKT